MPTLHGCYRSRASRNIWLAEEIGLDLPLRTVWQAYRLDDPQGPDAPLNTQSPEFLALSPMGAIPVLEDEGLVLAESLAINLYLARQHGGEVGPRDEAENALMVQWALFAAASVEEPALAIQNAYQYGRTETEEGRAEVERAKEKLQRPLNALEAHLGVRQWMVGSRFTVADINMAEIVRYAQADPGLLPLFPAVDGWLRMCQGRPAFQRMWARRAQEPARP
ncbi:MAG TPA: glutathione S-transferase family protein [Rubellimicrobium sp.]|nr:glutathione S-transferase family protein [Rubellimicrobium sp.]